ncbi:MAG: DUF4382 domain-containing protein [Salinibacter sp.]|uniref:DUF4382 domain-containing protein n=1 Tax=Salinibacter sp. TaxID=2065818 RepID=UPI0035D4C0D4
MIGARHSNRFVVGLLVAAGFLVWMVGCDSTGNVSTGQGQFTLKLTDAPADLDRAVVTVDRVELVTGDADEEEEDDDGDDDEEGIITLMDTSRQINLLKLQDGVTTTLADTTVPEGEYTQLRFVLGDENYVVADGDRQNLQVPSGKQSGIKIILPDVEVENDGDRLSVTLDFDVEESFVRAGASGKYLFKPTVKVKSVSVNGESIETVEVEGAVSGASGESVSVDSIGFSVTDQTEFDGDDGATSVADLQSGQAIEVEGTRLDDGSLRAREVDVEDDDEVERSITAPVEALGDDSLTLLGVPVEVTNGTEFEDDRRLEGLSPGDRVEVNYEFREGSRIALEIEDEDD